MLMETYPMCIITVLIQCLGYHHLLHCNYIRNSIITQRLILNSEPSFLHGAILMHMYINRSIKNVTGLCA